MERAIMVKNELGALRAVGRGNLRRRLEVMVNDGRLGVAGAQKVYFDVFGDKLKVIRDKKPGFWERLRSLRR